MRFLLDQPISRVVAESLKAAGHEAQHVQELGLSKADDAVILNLAAELNAVIITQDTDYGTLLATLRAALPSVILFRMRDGHPLVQVRILLGNLPNLEEPLGRGTIIVFTDKGIRVRSLPVFGGVNQGEPCMQRQPEPEYMDLPEEAEAYAAADFSQVNEAFVARLIEVAGGRERATALDLGTGPADIPIGVVKQRPGWHVTAADASQAMLDIAAKSVARAGFDGCIELVLTDAKALNLPAGKFDVVFCNSILHHINDVDAFWSQIKRVAAVGAVIFVRDLARPADEAAARRIVDQNAGSESALLQEEFYRSLLAAYTVDEVRDQLWRVGLAGLQVWMVTDRHLDVFGTLHLSAS